MRVNVTLRCLASVPVKKTTVEELPEGCTVRELCTRLIRAEEKLNGSRFSGTDVVTLVNGRVAAPDQALLDGDEVKILPVILGG